MISVDPLVHERIIREALRWTGEMNIIFLFKAKCLNV